MIPNARLCNTPDMFLHFYFNEKACNKPNCQNKTSEIQKLDEKKRNKTLLINLKYYKPRKGMIIREIQVA